jgi:thioredoxin-related protein
MNEMQKSIKNRAVLGFSNALVFILIVVLAVNVVTMGLFTFIVDDKLDEALDLARPQEGTLTLISPVDCDKCKALDVVKSNFASKNVEISEDVQISYAEEGAKELIEKYSIKKLPVLIFKSDEKIKTVFAESVKKLGGVVVNEDAVVIEQPAPPYFDLGSAKMLGEVTVTFIADDSCKGCYDVLSVQKPILSKFGIYIAKESLVDVSDNMGSGLVEKYNVTSVPTMILSADAKYYEQFVSAWGSVGSIESDGSFVLRKLDAMGLAYKDLKSGKVVEPAQESAK